MHGAFPRWLALLCLALGFGCLAGPAFAQRPEAPADRIYPTNATPRAAAAKPAAQLRQERAVARTSAAACDRGETAACHALAETYRLGLGVGQSRPVAAILYRQACDGGWGEACLALGQLELVASDPQARADAAIAFDRACALGNPGGCMERAQLLYGGRDGAPDHAGAEVLARQACASDLAEACVTLGGWLVEPGRAEADAAEGFALLDRYCGGGDLAACTALIATLAAAPEPDEAALARYHYRACQAGGAMDCSAAGDRAWHGFGMAQDRQFALAMYDHACALDRNACADADAVRSLPDNVARCDAGERDACVALGLGHARGASVIYDPERAFDLLAPACEEGVLAACEKAADLLHSDLRSRGGDRLARSVPILERACAGGNGWYCNRLAAELAAESNPHRDLPRAAAIYADLCARDADEGACWQLDNLAGALPDAPVGMADARYTAPLTAADEAALADQRQKEARRRAARACTDTEVKFRGRTYRDRICDNVVYALNGYRMKPGQAPWQALLWRPPQLNGQTLSGSQRVLCGGALIRRGWILTAAHCLIDQGRSVFGQDYRIRLGVYNPRASEGVSYPIERIYPHPDFDPKTYAYDIALVRYDPDRAVKDGAANSIAGITVDPQELGQRAIADGMEVYAYGWGWTAASASETTDHLRGVKMQLESPRDCTRITGFTGLRQDAALCAGGTAGEQACTGDSGGALVYYGDRDRIPKVIGVVSAGRKCGTRGEPSRYTRVAKVRKWLDGIMRAPAAR